MKDVPKRWLEYEPLGNPVPNTKLLPFKVPLKQELCRKVALVDWFTPETLMTEVPSLRAIIDLTDTDRYYDPSEFRERGLRYFKINIPGQGKIPGIRAIERFYNTVDQLTKSFHQDSDALIGVHCTHGLNRTGYLICKYMVDRLHIDPNIAIHDFEAARGYPMERKVFKDDILRSPGQQSPSSDGWTRVPSKKNISKERLRNTEGNRHSSPGPSGKRFPDTGMGKSKSSPRKWKEEKSGKSIRPTRSASPVTNWRLEPRRIPQEVAKKSTVCQRSDFLSDDVKGSKHYRSFGK